MKAIGLILLSLAGTLRAAVPVRDPELNLTFTLPDGFEPSRDLLRQPNIVQGYLLPAKEGQTFGVVVLVERLAGTVGRGSFGASLKTKDGRTLSVVQERWKSFMLDVVAVPEVVQGFPCVTLNVQVPLKPHAAQIKVFSEQSREEELRALLRTILASADGPTNWLTEAESRERLAEGAGRLTAVAALLGYGIYRLVKWRRSRSRRA